MIDPRNEPFFAWMLAETSSSTLLRYVSGVGDAVEDHLRLDDVETALYVVERAAAAKLELFRRASDPGYEDGGAG
jgi:hypothetical protein